MLLFKDEVKQKPINVASVPMRSPFRYAGGKTWFVPYIRKWLRLYEGKIDFVEPFAGGGIVSLTVAFENLARSILMVEKDEDVASVWQTILGREYKWLVDQITSFEVTAEAAREIIGQNPKSLTLFYSLGKIILQKRKELLRILKSVGWSLRMRGKKKKCNHCTQLKKGYLG